MTPRFGALAGGASSPVRAGAAVGGDPFVQTYGRGAYAYDDDGRAHVDYVMAYGPLLFGHAHPSQVAGLDSLAARGSVFGATHAEEVRLADRMAQHLPAMELLRFTSTGTEAMMSALRVARAYTGRPRIVRFAGNYHGHFDAALASAGASAAASGAVAGGISPGARGDALVARYNDLHDLDAILDDREDEIAAIAVEPVAANMGLVLPDSGFLDGLFARARRIGALVVFDEVITWLRLGLGGAQGALGYVPDLTALGKIMGGGFPLAAFGGRADVMAALAPEGSAFAGGTFSGNPFCIALGHRTLDAIESDPHVYARLDRNARLLAGGLREIFAALALDISVVQCASMVDFKFRLGPPVRNFDEAAQADRLAFASYYHAMRERGVLLAPSPNELMFLSTEHGEREIALTLEAAGASFRMLRDDGLI
ncbi:MAG: glutamate-1-semialdehyde 2,1-aminomutase [Candidatus Eremiobacteraeota bacterium]|nr:glutamate-1-semialdehyde 2,1-aminomutase [Candidatus Eremiobacteraeota bacterium]